MSFAFDETKYRNQWNLPGWTMRMDDTVRVGWLGGKPVLQIAAEVSAVCGLPVSYSMIYKRAHYLNLRMRDSAWTPEIVEDLRVMHAAGKSASVMRKELNEKYGTQFTRNAVCGKIHRMGLPARISTTTFKGRTAHGMARANQERVQRIRKALGHNFTPMREFTRAPVIADMEIPQEQRKSFVELRRGHCRWPVGDVGEPGFFFCGGTAKKDHSYCVGHFAVAYRGR